MPRRAVPIVAGEYYFSRHMQRFSISYTKAINKRYDRVGALFQGQYQARCMWTEANTCSIYRGTFI